MDLENERGFYKVLQTQLLGNAKLRSNKVSDVSMAIANYFQSLVSVMYVGRQLLLTLRILIVDEVDHINSIVQTVFTWASLPNSKLIVFGLSNSLDLPLRQLHHLKGTVCSSPHLPEKNPQYSLRSSPTRRKTFTK